MHSTTNRRRRGRVSKGEWLSTALDELERGGIEAVRVERLAAILSVAKSGFYWHFKNRNDLHQQMLEFWLHEYTEVVTSNPQLQVGAPKVRLARITRTIQEHDLAKYDLAIRAWAKHDEIAQGFVERVTTVRFKFIRQIFSDLGFEGDELEMRTMLFVCYQTWENDTFGEMSIRKRSRIRKRRLEFLSSK
jgi:AcrR family transcriptional regulator